MRKCSPAIRRSGFRQIKRLVGWSTALSLSLFATAANADLVGGAPSNSASISAWPGTPDYQSLSNANLTGFTSQGQPTAASGATYTLLSEIVKPDHTFTLGSIKLIGGGGAQTNNQLQLHVYQLSSSGGTNFVSSSDAFYFPGADLLGNGNGLAFNFNGFSGQQMMSFDLSNGPGSNDQVTLNSGQFYAVEIWSQVAGGSNLFLWSRNSVVDPNGQMFAKTNAQDFSTSRNTIAAVGLAGGSPRTAAIALYAVPEPGTITAAAIGLGALSLFRRRRT